MSFEPKIDLRGRCQNDRHRLGVNWNDNRVCLRSQEAEEFVLSYDRRGEEQVLPRLQPQSDLDRRFRQPL